MPFRARCLLPPLLGALALGGGLALLEWATPAPAVPPPPRAVPLGATDDPGREIRLVWMGQPTFPGGLADTWASRRIRELFAIRLEPVFLDPLGYEQKKPLMLASGDLPDVWWEGDPVTLQQAVRHGIIAEIPLELIAQHAPTYLRELTAFAPVAWLYAAHEGRNFGLPTYFRDGRFPNPGMWRMDWLRRVGIERVPETLDEMHEALRRCTFNDPDGNGRQDTWGMTGDVSVQWWQTFHEIFGAFGVTPYDWQEVDGAAVWGGVRPEAREALALLRAWHAEGLIHPDFVSDDARVDRSIDRKFALGRIGYRNTGGVHYNFDLEQPRSLYQDLRRLHPGLELVPGVLPSGPRGQRGGRVWGPAGNIMVFGRHVADDPAKVVRVLRMIEANYRRPELSIELTLGPEGVFWDWRDPARGPGSGIRLIQDRSHPDDPMRNFADPRIARRNLLTAEGHFYLAWGTVPAHYDRYALRAELEFNARFRPAEHALTNVLGKSDVVPSAGRLLGDLRMLQQTTYAAIIRGDQPLEDFDLFVRRWHDRGGAILTAEATALLAEKRRLFARLETLVAALPGRAEP